jgi:hypothetical protein
MSQDCLRCAGGESVFRGAAKGKPVDKLVACNASAALDCLPEADCTHCPHLPEVVIVDLQKEET